MPPTVLGHIMEIVLAVRTPSGTNAKGKANVAIRFGSESSGPLDAFGYWTELDWTGRLGGLWALFLLSFFPSLFASISWLMPVCAT